jgi:hypothetical protein
MAAADPIARLRKICLALPGVIEKEAWGEATFRAGPNGKMFAMTSNNHHHDGIVAVWCMAPPGYQEAMIKSAPDRFYRPPYVGHNGWVGMRLDAKKPDWDEIAAVIEGAYKMAANAKKPAKKRARSNPLARI